MKQLIYNTRTLLIRLIYKFAGCTGDLNGAGGYLRCGEYIYEGRYAFTGIHTDYIASAIHLIK